MLRVSEALRLPSLSTRTHEQHVCRAASRHSAGETAQHGTGSPPGSFVTLLGRRSFFGINRVPRLISTLPWACFRSAENLRHRWSVAALAKPWAGDHEQV
jgi:hypothetical protein